MSIVELALCKRVLLASNAHEEKLCFKNDLYPLLQQTFKNLFLYKHIQYIRQSFFIQDYEKLDRPNTHPALFSAHSSRLKIWSLSQLIT